MSFTSLQNIEITVQTKTNTGDDFKPVYTWSTFTTLDAIKDLIREKEQPRDEGNVVLADTIFYCDYYAGITNTMRISYGSDLYDIYQIHNPNEMNKHLEIKCRKQYSGETNDNLV